jgi:hypothetical protein
LNSDPDSDEQLERIKDSLHFILGYCRNKQITLSQYLQQKDDIIPAFVIHLKEHKVNIYTLLGFNLFAKELNAIDASTIRFIIGEETYDKIDLYRTKLFGSQKARILVEKGLQKINTTLKQNS